MVTNNNNDDNDKNRWIWFKKANQFTPWATSEGGNTTTTYGVNLGAPLFLNNKVLWGWSYLIPVATFAMDDKDQLSATYYRNGNFMAIQHR